MRAIGAMLLRAVAAFDRWVRDPVDPRPLCWFRCWFGVLSLVNILLLWPDMPMWLGDGGVLPPEVHQPPLAGPSLTVYAFSADVAAIWLIRGLGVVGGLGMCLGVLPRWAAACSWLAVTSYSWRNPLILHSGDALLRIGAFFLIFAHTDAVLSLPRWLRRRGTHASRRPEPPHPVPAWPQRILQLQLCILYLVTGIWKCRGPAWQDGTAVGIVLQMGEFQRFPIPDVLLTPVASRVLTWATLAFELGFPLLVWPRALRLPVLLLGLAFHAGLEWMLNVQLFQWTITAFYLLFLQPTAHPPVVAPPDDQRPREAGAGRSSIARSTASSGSASVSAAATSPGGRFRVMRSILLAFCPIACAVACHGMGAESFADGPPTRPNIPYVAVDDLGWSDVGWHAGFSKTPTLDGLVREGGTRVCAFVNWPGGRSRRRA